MQPRANIDPRLRVLFLVGAAVGIFLLPRLWMVAAAVGALAVAWLVVGLPPRRLARQVLKLWGFALFLIASYALTREDPSVDRWVHVPVLSWTLALNVGGAVVGATMVLRVIAIVLASQVASAGDARAIAAGLTKLGVPRLPAVSIDAVLALLGGGGGGGGGGGRGGGGGGGGRRHARATEAAHDDTSATGGAKPVAAEGFWAAVKRLARGDVGPIVNRLERQIRRAEDHARAENVPFVRDVGVIAGVTLTMLGIRALKILPSIPVAPGHKLVLLTPLYIVASLLSRTRFGATLTGLTMGAVAFLLGDGGNKYGIFEILKHVTPGILCDLFVPMLVRGGRMPGGLTWSLFGFVIAVARVATILTVVALVQAPKVAYVMLVPSLLIHGTFGAASGYVSYHIVRAVGRLRDEVHLADKELA